MRKKIIMILWLLIISLGALSQTIDFSSLDKRIVTISQDKFIYHWTKKETIKERSREEFNLESTFNYIINTIRYGENKGNAHGLYFAMDPLVSSSYGEFALARDNWVLVSYKIPKGTKFLDSVSNLKLSSGEKEWFRSRGCPVKSIEAFGQYTSIQGNQCAEAFNEFYKLKNISGIIYEWNQSQLPFCAPFDQTNIPLDKAPSIKVKPKAIILRDTKVIQPQDIFILDASREFFNDEYNGKENDFLRILHTYSFRYSEKFPNPKVVSSFSFPQVKVMTDDELKKTMFNCL